MDRNIVLFMYCVMIGIYGLYLFFMLDLSVMDSEYSDLQNKREAIHLQNMELRDKLLQKESYHTIDRAARARGFVNAEIVYLK